MILQIAIAVMSLAATFLSLRSARTQRYACFFGIAVQPLWMASTLHAHQWGMFFLSWVYGAIYVHSFWHHWIRRA